MSCRDTCFMQLTTTYPFDCSNVPTERIFANQFKIATDQTFLRNEWNPLKQKNNRFKKSVGLILYIFTYQTGLKSGPTIWFEPKALYSSGGTYYIVGLDFSPVYTRYIQEKQNPTDSEICRVLLFTRICIIFYIIRKIWKIIFTK